MILTHIVACSENNVIGAQGGLPWSLPEDMKFFRETTKGHVMIMGRKTFESFNGRALPNRYHIVITRTPETQSFKSTDTSPVVFVKSLEEAIEHARPLTVKWGDEVFIIGGGEIYQQSMPRTDKIYLTRIHQEFHGDTLYPKVDEQTFKLVAQRDVEMPIPFSFLTYLRK